MVGNRERDVCGTNSMAGRLKLWRLQSSEQSIVEIRTGTGGALEIGLAERRAGERLTLAKASKARRMREREMERILFRSSQKSEKEPSIQKPELRLLPLLLGPFGVAAERLSLCHRANVIYYFAILLFCYSMAAAAIKSELLAHEGEYWPPALPVLCGPFCRGSSVELALQRSL